VSDDAFREALRDLIPDYTGPVDPVPRVFASVRRRRIRQRTLLAVGGAGMAVVLAVAAPALLLPGRGGGAQSAAPYDPSADSFTPPFAVHPVAAGVVDGADWAIGSTTLEPGARRCLFSNDDVSTAALTCFDGWKPGAAVTWSAVSFADKGPKVTQITGVAPTGTASVRIRIKAAEPRTLPVTSNSTDRTARFFGEVLPGTVVVLDVTALDDSGSALGDPVADPGHACTSTPYQVCAPPK
jgi:hypothetical protein